MIATDMLARVRRIIEDPDGERFTDAEIYNSLTDNELKVANLIHKNYLSELRVINTSLTFTDGALAISGLTPTTVLGGADGIITVKTSDGYFASKIEPKDLSTLNNTYMTGNIKSPLIYILENEIKIIPVAVTTGDVYFLKQPEGISATDDSVLNEVLHGIIITYTCAEFFANDNKLDRSNVFEQRGIIVIKTLNNKFIQEEI